MFHTLGKALLGLCLLIPYPVLADIIHWEVHSNEDAPSFLGEDFLLTGGFDFNTETGAISNITVQTSAIGCIACNDFSDGGTATVFSVPDGRGGVNFTETYGPSGDTLGRDYFLQIAGSNAFGEEFAFDVSQPNSYANLSLWHHGLILLNDPLDPDIFEDVSCDGCVHAVGTLTTPVPEPETYAMLLTGVAALGWRMRRKGRA